MGRGGGAAETEQQRSRVKCSSCTRRCSLEAAPLAACTAAYHGHRHADNEAAKRHAAQQEGRTCRWEATFSRVSPATFIRSRMRLGTALSTPSWFTASTNCGAEAETECSGHALVGSVAAAIRLIAPFIVSACRGLFQKCKLASQHTHAAPLYIQTMCSPALPLTHPCPTCWCISTLHTTRGFLLAPCVSCCTWIVSLSLRFTPWWCCGAGIGGGMA